MDLLRRNTSRKQHGAARELRFRHFLIGSIVVSLLLIVFVLLLTTRSHLSSHHLPFSLRSSSALDPLPPLPRFFQNYPTLEAYGPVADAHWETLLLSPNGGFIKVQRNETFVESWGISMFHALHCLRMLRDALAPTSSEHSEHSHHSRTTHLTHCFTYLAQSLLCAADDTIEAPVPEYNRHGEITGFRVDGIGVQHKQCRDPALLYAVASKTEQSPLTRDWPGLQGAKELIWDSSVWENGKCVGEIF
jgi:hypothetical protein